MTATGLAYDTIYALGDSMTSRLGGWLIENDYLTAYLPFSRFSRVVKNMGVGGDGATTARNRIGVFAAPTFSFSGGTVKAKVNLFDATLYRETTQSTRAEIYRKFPFPDNVAWSADGVPVAAVSAPLRTSATLAASGNAVTVADDGTLASGDMVWVERSHSGLSAFCPFYIVGYSGGMFQLSLSPGGAAVTISADATSELCGPWATSWAAEAAPESVTVRAVSTEMHGQPLMIWLGHNAADTTTLQVIAGIIAELQPREYMVFSVVNSADQHAESTGSDLVSYNAVMAMNEALKATYSGHFFDVREFLLGQYILGTDDATEHARGIIPARLRTDVIHLNATGCVLLANQLPAAWAACGYSI